MEEIFMTIKNTPKTIGERIKILREKNKESQEKLGEAINLSQNSISKLEKGETQLTLENQCNLVKHFNVSHDYLITGKDTDSILSLLEKYVSLEYSRVSNGETSLEYPVLRINKVLFDYLIRTAKAKQDNYLPNEIKLAWIEREINSFYESNKNNPFSEYESVIPIPQNLIYPYEDKDTWKQTDLLHAMNRELLESTKTNCKREEDL